MAEPSFMEGVKRVRAQLVARRPKSGSIASLLSTRRMSGLHGARADTPGAQLRANTRRHIGWTPRQNALAAPLIHRTVGWVGFAGHGARAASPGRA
jgi:hypothetical protein